MEIINTPLGIQIKSEKLCVLFGNKSADINSISASYKGLTFKRIKQVHGDHIVSSNPHSIDFSAEADAHFTTSAHLGLCISTADCAPIMLYCPTIKMILGLHAGWRGIEKRILPKALELLRRKGSDPVKIHCFVGPHIQFKNFEVQDDVKDLLLKSCRHSSLKLSAVKPVSESKSLVDLSAILKMQASEFNIPEKNCYFDLTDTVNDRNFHSHRRDKENSGRQLSFIALTS